MEHLEQLIHQLVALDTSPEGNAHAEAAALLREELHARGFGVSLERDALHPLVIAHRQARGGQGHVLLYGHYDVDEVVDGWTSPPFTLQRVEDRWVGLGVGDNKGALAARLVALDCIDASPAITWIIQSAEETGSADLRAYFAEHGLPEADWFVDENGWSSEDGTQRVLACLAIQGQDAPLDEAMCAALSRVFSTSGVPDIQHRKLNKRFVPGGCAFHAALPYGSRYLAVGTNDPLTRIHHPNESVSVAKCERHSSEFASFLQHIAGGLL